MKNILFLMMAALVIMGCSKDSTFTDDNDDNKEIPEVSVTVDASDIKVVSATLTGNVNSTALEEDRLGVTNYGFIVSKNSNPTKENGWVLKGSNIKGNEFSVIAMNLAPTEQYYYVSFFYDGSKYYYGEVLSFSTKSFNMADLKAKANTGETVASLEGKIDYDKIGYFDSHRLGFNIIEAATIYRHETAREGAHCTYNASIDHLSAETDYDYYFFVEYIDKTNKKQTLKGENLNFHTTNLELETGMVDLGLSVLWAGANLGASSPERYGDFFAWGETETKENFELSNYLYKDVLIGIETDPHWPGGTKFYNISGTNYDAANKKIGNGWRMPSEKECDELADNCEWKYMAYKKTWGFLVTGSNGNRIFLPAGGKKYNGKHENTTNYCYVWSGDCSTSKHSETGKICDVFGASYTIIGLSKGTNEGVEAYLGLNIRPVKNKN